MESGLTFICLQETCFYRCDQRIQNDGLTLDLATRVSDHIENCTGHAPIMVINNLHRSKLDPNRDIAPGTFGEEIPTRAFYWYRSNITKAINEVTNTNNTIIRGLLLDIHGYKDDFENRALLGKCLTFISCVLTIILPVC